MADIFEIKWRQSSGPQGTTPQSQTYSIPTDNSIYELNPVNSNWGSKGCYAGALAQNGSLMGGGSTMKWDGWNANLTQSDMRDFTISSYQNSAQQNLRFMVKFGGNGFTTRQNYKWTNIPEAVAGQIQSGYSNMTTTSNVREYNPYSRAETNISITGSTNSPLTLAPINNLKINQLIWQPIFYIAEIEYYDYENGCYKSRDVVVPVAKTFAQIKPIDKTPAGADYDEDLWTKGWKEISPTKEGGRRFRFITGCLLVPYYGKSSYTYNDGNDTYTAGLNPDDGLVYGTRNIFGEMISDSGKYPVINTTNCSRPCLTVMSEVLDENTGAVIYSTPPGIMFANISSYTIETSQFTVHNYQLNAAHQLFTGSIYFTDFWFNNNDTYNQFFKSSADVYGEPTLTCPQIIGNVGGLISTLDNTYPTGTLYFLADGPIAYSTDRTGTRINPMTCSYFSGQSLWATIASLGCYVAADTETAQKAQVGAYVGNNNRVYLGEMSASGITDGIMLQGNDIADAPQAAIDDIIKGTPYEPVTPGGGGGGDGEYPGPNPSGENQPDYKGDSIPGRTDRGNLGNIGASATYYVLSDNLMGNFNDKLWGQPSDFYEALQFTLNATPSIFDYIISCTYYPLNLSRYKGSAQEVYMGTGAKFGLNEYVLNTLSINLNFGSISLSDSIFHPYTDGEAFLNLSPYTQISITLPYAGSYDLNASEVAGGTLSLEGDLSFITGKITYTLTLATPEGASYPILKHSAKVGCDMKLSGADGSRQAASMVGAGINWAKSLMGAGSSLVSTGMAAAGGDVKGMVSGMADSTNKILDFTQDTANLALASKEIPLQVGNSDGFDAIFSTQSAFITVYRPKLSNPPNYGHATGYLTEGTSTIGSLSGFTVCRNPDLKGFSAMDEEKAEIQQILTTGFYA